MKIALVHELLTMKGGAERVLRILADMYPDAPIYTLLYNEQKLGEWFPKQRVRTSAVQRLAKRLPLGAYRYNHHLYLRRFPKAVEAWDFSEFDVVISSSSAFAHGIRTNGNPKHLCYVHSPARYLWDRTHDVMNQANAGLLGLLKRKYLERTLHKLRVWDSEVAPRPDKLLAVSKEVQRRIELYWRRESQVVHPPIDDFWLEDGSVAESDADPYFLIVSSLVPYKRIDIAIEACNQIGAKLKIVGEGPDKSRLQQLAGTTVEFLGYRDKEELKQLYTQARAVIFAGDEDFGLVPLEAMSQGTPVVAYRSGGALETIAEGETGMFFDLSTADSLKNSLIKFIDQELNLYSVSACQIQAARFSRQQFEEGIREAVATL